MKKITLNSLLFSLFVCCSFLFVVSCTEDNIELVKHNVSVEELLLDENFIAIGETMYDYAGFVKNTIEEKGLSSSDMLPQLEALTNDESSDENKAAKLNEMFKINISQRLESNAVVISSNMEILNSKYNDLDEALLTNAISEHFENKNAANVGARGCGDLFYVCAGGLATSGAGLCFLGCTSATVGLGAAPCAVFCGLLYTGGIVGCYDNYCS
jgi:hypothetical protein